MGVWDKLLQENNIVMQGLSQFDLITTDRFSSGLNNMLDTDKTYSIGFHQINVYKNEDTYDEYTIIDSFLNNGIKTRAPSEYGGVVQVVAMLGNSNVLQKIKTAVNRFYYLSKVEDMTGACVVAIPESLEGKDGKQYSLGKFPDGLDHSVRDVLKPEDYPISVLFNRLGYLPREFILGMVTNDRHGGVFVTPNENFISSLPKEKQSELLEQYFEQGLPKKEFKDKSNQRDDR